MKIADYFSGIERNLRRIKGAEISGKIATLASDDYNGLLRCRVLFWDESYLDVYETVNTEWGHPIKIRNSYTYIADGKRVFRYDNAPHHPEIKTHLHHRHTGVRDLLSPADEPTQSQVLREIELLLIK